VRSETLRAIGEVASGAAHHLNNLLGIIAGRTELLIRRLAASDHLRSLETVNRAALDAAEVVRRIRSFSRAHTTPLLESLDLNKLVQEIVELTRPRWFDQAQRQGVRIDVTVEPGARISAEISAVTVTVGGQVEGNINASTQVKLLQSGQLIGDLKAKSLTVAAGSRMRGRVEFGWDEHESKKIELNVVKKSENRTAV
jgi:signal transduction histidine kinase